MQEVKKRKGNEGYNVATGEYEDLVKAGVVDPTKVTRSALQNAASIPVCSSPPRPSSPRFRKRKRRLRCRQVAEAWAEWTTKSDTPLLTREKTRRKESQAASGRLEAAFFLVGPNEPISFPEARCIE